MLLKTWAGFIFTLFACACLPATTLAAQTVKLETALTPEHLGQGSTISFSFTVATDTSGVPPPLTGVDLYYPANLGVVTSGLGLVACRAATLEAIGPEGCPSLSQLGFGTALVEVPFGPEVIHEAASIRVFAGQLDQGHLGLLFWANGKTPVSAQIIFPGVILPAPDPFGGDLSTTIPLVPTLPGAPDAAVVKLSTTIGPAHLTYYERVRGRLLRYHPRGIALPRTCPRGGFGFAARFTFQDGTYTSAHTTVPCPPANGPRRRR